MFYMAEQENTNLSYRFPDVFSSPETKAQDELL